jgi:ERF superfamily
MQELIKALIAAKGDFQTIPKDKINPHYKSKYSTLDAVLGAVEPALAKHGLVLTHQAKGDEFITTLYHESGQCLSSSLPLPSFADPQKMGSWISYARRYSITGLLSVCSDEDDDGNQAAQKSPASSRSANYQATKSPAKAEGNVDPLYLLKRNVGQAFKNLGWDLEQITEWNDTNFGGRPSAKWIAEDWQRANQMLSALVDQDAAEAMIHA